jgi:HD-like signal output (HDOD) protein
MATDPKAILSVAQVPSIPETLRQVLRACNDPATTSAKLERLVLKDPGLAIRLLRQVNSSFFFLPQRVTSVAQAVVLLGFPTVRAIAAGLVMIETFGRMKDIDPKYLSHIWGHSLMAAGMVPLLAGAADPAKRDDLYVAAMTQNSGHLILARHFQEPYHELRGLGEFPEPEFEEQKLGVNHAQISGELLEQWEFPREVVRLARTHHDDSESSTADIAVLRLADRLAEALRASPDFLDRRESDLPPGIAVALDDCGISWTQLQRHRDAFARLQELSGYEGSPD